jgi:RND superfamily putative drug exporter
VLSIAGTGTTVGVDLMLDALIVRTFVLPAVIGPFGRWSWWPGMPSRTVLQSG